MTAIRTQPTVIVKGDQRDFPFTYRVRGGANIDMTGFTVVASLGEAGDLGLTWTDRTHGQFTLTLQENKSILLPENEIRKLVIKFTDPLGDVRTPAILWVKAITQ